MVGVRETREIACKSPATEQNEKKSKRRRESDCSRKPPLIGEEDSHGTNAAPSEHWQPQAKLHCFWKS